MINIFEPKYIWLDKVDSTNTYCMDLAQKGEVEGTAVAAYYQEQGRGQRGNTWESEGGMNLTFSLLLRPTFLRVDEQFLISKMIALSICEWLKINGVEAKIKWPNDIYIGDKKVAGILIENSFSGPTLDICIVGIGLNLNQMEFPPDIPNPISMKLLKGVDYKPEVVLSELMISIQIRYLQLRYGLKNKVSDDYMVLLYKLNTFSNYKCSEGLFRARIIGVKPGGELILETDSGIQRVFSFKEISFEVD